MRAVGTEHKYVRANLKSRVKMSVALTSPNKHMQRAVCHKVLARGRASGSLLGRARAQLALRTAADVGR